MQRVKSNSKLHLLFLSTQTSPLSLFQLSLYIECDGIPADTNIQGGSEDIFSRAPWEDQRIQKSGVTCGGGYSSRQVMKSEPAWT